MQHFSTHIGIAVLISVMEFGSLSAAEETTVRKFPVSERTEIHLAAPASWSHEIAQAPLGLEATLEFKPKTGPSFHVLLTPIGETKEQSGEALRTFAEKMAQAAGEQSVEKKIELAEIKGDTVTGYSFSATDRAPKPGEFKYITSGVVRISNTMLTFTILTNDGQQDVVKQALAMIRSAKSVASEIRFIKSVMKIPDTNIAIEFESPDLGKKQESRRGKDYAVRALAGKFNLSIFAEEPHGDGKTHEDCYKFYWPPASRNPKIAKETVKATAHDKYHRVEYDVVVKFGDESFTQRNVNYYFVFENRWFDVHFSVAAPTKDDDKVVAAFDKSLQYKVQGR